MLAVNVSEDVVVSQYSAQSTGGTFISIGRVRDGRRITVDGWILVEVTVRPIVVISEPTGGLTLAEKNRENH
jgi:hypothetical protein